MCSRPMMMLITPITGSRRSQLLRALSGALDGADEGAPDATLLEGRDARDGGATRRGDHVLELARVRTGLQNEARRAEHGLGGQYHRDGAIEPHLDAAVGQRLDDDSDIGRARARQPGHGVHGALVNHDHLADGAEELLRSFEVARLEALGPRDGRDALQHQGGRIGHDADEPRWLAEVLAELPRGDARRDGDQELAPVDSCGDFREDGGHDLGLDRQDDHVGVPDERHVVLDDVDAVLRGEIREAIRPSVRGRDGHGRDEPGLDEPLDERLPHVAGAEEGHTPALDAHAPASVPPALAGRGPKMAEPTRTMVAPSSMATSKSPLMPMEQCSSPAASRSSRSRLNQGRDASAVSVAGGMHMSPRTSSCLSPISASSSRLSSAGCTPLFCGSSPTLTWTSTRTTRSSW